MLTKLKEMRKKNLVPEVDQLGLFCWLEGTTVDKTVRQIPYRK